MPYGWSSPDQISKKYSEIIDSLTIMADGYYCLGKLNDAIKLLEACQQFMERFTEEEIQSYIRVRVAVQLSEVLCASIFYQNVHLDNVLPTLLLTRQWVEAAPDMDEQNLSNMLDCLGLAHYYHRLNTGEGNSSTSLAYFQQALALFQRFPDLIGESNSLFHIGLLYENGDQPDIDKAFFYYTKAYQLAREKSDRLERSYAARHLGGIAEMRGNYEQARQYFEESLTVREENDFKLSFPLSHVALGDICVKQKERDTAELHYQKAIQFAWEMDVPIPHIIALLSVGDFYQIQDEPTKALPCFEEALAIAKKLEAPQWMSEAASRIAGIAS